MLKVDGETFQQMLARLLREKGMTGPEVYKTARSDSDYDVFVIGNEGLRKTVLRLRDATDKLGVEVNPYVLSRAEFERRIKSGDHFLSEVMSSPKIFLKESDNELTAMA